MRKPTVTQSDEKTVRTNDGPVSMLRNERNIKPLEQSSSSNVETKLSYQLNNFES